MNFHQLLFHRQALLRQARLANLAFACQQLSGYADRIARAGLTGEVRLHETGSESEGYGAALTALQGSQAVIEEHFTDEDLLELAELVAYGTDCELVDSTLFLIDQRERAAAVARSRVVDVLADYRISRAALAAARAAL